MTEWCQAPTHSLEYLKKNQTNQPTNQNMKCQ